VLALQGIGWLTRRAIAWATITLHTKQYVSSGGDEDDGVTHIDIEQTATGGIQGTTEQRTLDWRERAHEDHLFGALKARSRWTDVADDGVWGALDPFLVDGWLEGEGERGGPAGERHVQSWAVNEERGWTAEQIWGFAVVEGERYYVRRVVVTKDETVLKVRTVYDWQGRK
jgi:hypothetical protein